LSYFRLVNSLVIYISDDDDAAWIKLATKACKNAMFQVVMD